MCKYEFDTGNGMPVVIWSEKWASRNLILEIVFYISYLVPKMGKYEFDTEKGISVMLSRSVLTDFGLLTDFLKFLVCFWSVFLHFGLFFLFPVPKKISNPFFRNKDSSI